jgi:hypothetical protein
MTKELITNKKLNIKIIGFIDFKIIFNEIFVNNKAINTKAAMTPYPINPDGKNTDTIKISIPRILNRGSSL